MRGVMELQGPGRTCRVLDGAVEEPRHFGGLVRRLALLLLALPRRLARRAVHLPRSGEAHAEVVLGGEAVAPGQGEGSS